MPANSAARPTGQVTGAVSSASVEAISSNNSIGSRLSRSILLMNVRSECRAGGNLEQLAGPGLDPLGGVDHHDRGIHRGERAVGVLGEILVARRIEQVEHAPGVFERHHRGHHGNAAVALDAHPVRARAAALALGAHVAGELDGAAGAQQVFRQCGLAGIGVGDDREGAAAGYFGGGVGHRGLMAMAPGGGPPAPCVSYREAGTDNSGLQWRQGRRLARKKEGEEEGPFSQLGSV